MKKILVILFLLNIVLAVKSQNYTEYPFQKSYYYFIEYDSNNLEYFGDRKYFNAFYSKLQRLMIDGKGKVNICQIGGSHIQADVFTSQLRNRFQNSNGGLSSGRGLVFPLRLARTNTPYGYHFRYTGSWETIRNVEKDEACDIGVMGITANTSDTNASLTLLFEPEYKKLYEFNSIKIFHKIDSFSYKISVDSNIFDTSIVNVKKGYTEIFLNQYVDSIKVDFVKTDSIQNYFELYALWPQSDDAGINVHNLGINGAAVPSFLRCNLLENQMNVIEPDLVIFGLGINDAYGRNFSQSDYEKNYKDLVKRIRQAYPNTAIIYVTNNDSYLWRRYVNRNGFKVQESMKKLALTHDAAVWDMFEIMGGLNSIVRWERAGLAKRDKIHFTHTGYVLVGDLLFDAIMKDYGDYLQNNETNNAEANLIQN